MGAVTLARYKWISELWSRKCLIQLQQRIEGLQCKHFLRCLSSCPVTVIREKTGFISNWSFFHLDEHHPTLLKGFLNQEVQWMKTQCSFWKGTNHSHRQVKLSGTCSSEVHGVTPMYGSQRYRHTIAYLTVNHLLAELFKSFAVLEGDAVSLFCPLWSF